MIGGLPPQFGGARLLKDRRFHQGNRRTLTDSLGYIEKCADLSDIALVCLRGISGTAQRRRSRDPARDHGSA